MKLVRIATVAFVASLTLATAALGADVVITDNKGTTTLFKSVSIYLGPMSGAETSGVSVNQGSVRKSIPWEKVRDVEFMPEGQVKVTRTDGSAVEGELVINSNSSIISGQDVDGTAVSIRA